MSFNPAGLASVANPTEGGVALNTVYTFFYVSKTVSQRTGKSGGDTYEENVTDDPIGDSHLLRLR